MMTQTHTNINNSDNSYFTLNNPSVHNKPPPTTTAVQPHQQQQQQQQRLKSGLLNRRQPQASCLHQLELPSLPPLSQLLTTDTNNTKQKEESDAVVAAAVAAASVQQHHGMESLGYPTIPPQQPYFNAVAAAAAAAAAASTVVVNPAQTTTEFISHHTNNNNNSNAAATSNFVPVTTQEALIDPTAAFTMDPMYTMSMPSTVQPTSMMPLDTQTHNLTTRVRQLSNSSASSNEKIYSFVAIPGTNQKKRPRRRYDEIERLYHCNWPGCIKAYGTLNHLNAHVSMQKHGAKRHPSEFKEMRKEWRRQKKEREAQKKRNEEAMKQQHQEMMHNASYHPPPLQHLSHFPYGALPATAGNTMTLNGFY